jgi:hypothetical protein
MHFFAFFQLIGRAAIRALGFTGLDDFDVDTRMHAPERRMRAGTIHGEILGVDKDDIVLGFARVGCAAHGDSWVEENGNAGLKATLW